VTSQECSLQVLMAAILCVVFSLISLSRVFHQSDLLAAEMYPANNTLSDAGFWLLGQAAKPKLL